MTYRWFALLAVVPLVGSLPRQAGELSRARWLAGCWEQRSPTRVTIEMWMTPDAGLMMGASRTVVNGAVRETEVLKLESQNGRLVYTALPSGQSLASFTSTGVSDSSFVVENLEHDFPQRIIYRRRGADSLIARIEGTTPQGARGINYPMRRVACGG